MSDAINFDDPAELDRQYDITIAVPEIEAIAKSLVAPNAKIREEHSGYQEYAYGNAPLQKLDYFPAGKNAPLLIYIHGGYWHAFDKLFFSTVGEAWNDTGISVAVVNYRLAPAVSMTTIVEDVRQSIIWLWNNADKLGIIRSEMVVTGSSAGGHLSAMMLATDWSKLQTGLPKGLLKAGASISGLHDLEPFLHAPFLKDTLQLSADEVRDYSPARLKPPTAATLITCVGGDETPAFHAQNRLIAERWPSVFKADVPSPRTNHVTVNDELINPTSALFRAVKSLFSGDVK